MNEPKCSKFYRWLKRQTDRRDPVGDIARDVVADTTFPVEIGDFRKLRTYLQSQRADPLAVEALREAMEEFKRGP